MRRGFAQTNNDFVSLTRAAVLEFEKRKKEPVLSRIRIITGGR